MSGSSAILVCVLLGACSQTAMQASSPDRVSDEALHGLMTERINILQRSIEVLLYEQNRTQTELDQSRRRQTAEIASAALALRDSVAEVSELEPRLGLSSANSSTFVSLAQQLRNDSEELAELANGARVGSLEDAVSRLQTTCDSCHNLYRND